MSISTSDSVPHTARPAVWNTLLRSLSRVTSGGRFVPCVDGLRCIAILAVVLYHLNGYVVAKAAGFTEVEARETLMFHLLHGASCGVQIFFAISGFILALPFAREQTADGRAISLKHYYLRRVTRLEPPFLINLLIIYILLIIVRHQSPTDLMGPLVATMTYTHNWIYGQLSAVNAVTWSLEIEVQFYIVAPFLARWYFRSGRAVRRLSVVCAILGLIALKTSLPVAPSQKLRLGLAYTLDHFLTGIFIADLFVFAWQERPPRHALWDLVSLITLPTIFLIQLRTATWHLLPILTGLLFVSAFRGPLFNRILSLPLIVITGGMCYSIYLYHFLVISMMGRFTMAASAGAGYRTQLLCQAVLIVPPVICVCALFFAAIERPFMKWRPVAATG